MKAEEIRKLIIPASETYVAALPVALQVVSAALLREIAAQLAELKEHLKAGPFQVNVDMDCIDAAGRLRTSDRS